MTSHRLEQHGAAEPAADALGGDAALLAEPLHGVDQMQRDAVAAGPTGWPSAIAPPSTLSFVAIDQPGGAVEAEDLAAEFFVSQAARQPSTCAANASFSSQLDVVEPQPLRFINSVRPAPGRGP